MNHELPYRTFLDGGIHVANGTDYPVLSLNPAYTLYGAITRNLADGNCVGGEAERVTAYEAMYSYTASGAYFTFDEQKKGTLTPGKYADIVVLNFDPTTVDDEPEKILELEAEQTILGGKTVFIK
jgi:predicted amidohydrolase YtcJ